MLPYFLRAEDNERGAGALHGAGGPLRVSDGRADHVLARAWIEAAVDAGLPLNDDFNGPRQDGVGRYQVTQRGGMRCSAAVAYLHPALSRPNLTLLPGAPVRGCCSRATARSAPRRWSTASRRRSASSARSWCAPGPTTRRSC